MESKTGFGWNGQIIIILTQAREKHHHQKRDGMESGVGMSGARVNWVNIIVIRSVISIVIMNLQL